MRVDDSFYVAYQFFAKNKPEAEKESENIALEQSAELPLSAIPNDLRSYVGEVSNLVKVEEGRYQAKIHYRKNLAAGDPLQFLNVIFGNVSIKPGIRVIDIDRNYLAEIFPGPRLGIDGIRSLLSVQTRPLSCTALKPLGSTSEGLAKTAGQFAAGGIDIIKDDHGLANQPMSDFESRVRLCTESIRNGEQQSGKKTLYFPNITGPADEIKKRLGLIHQLGADGVLISPQLTGLNVLTDLANSDPPIPIMAHPAFSGPYTIHGNSGFDPAIYFGSIWRAFGADCIIYPNAGGRFSYTRDQCKSINKECRNTDLALRTSFPVPAGGIDRNSLADWVRYYDNDTVFLIGGSLYSHPDGLETATFEFQQTLRDYE